MERSVRNDPFYPIQTDTAELVTAPIEAALGADGNLGGGSEPHTDDRRGILPSRTDSSARRSIRRSARRSSSSAACPPTRDRWRRHVREVRIPEAA